jgi:ribosomal protein L7/L12
VPVAEQDVLTLLKQGRNIEGIERYRELNPGVGLRTAKRAVDRLKPDLDEPSTLRGLTDNKRVKPERHDS